MVPVSSIFYRSNHGVQNGGVLPLLGIPSRPGSQGKENDPEEGVKGATDFSSFFQRINSDKRTHAAAPGMFPRGSARFAPCRPSGWLATADADASAGTAALPSTRSANVTTFRDVTTKVVVEKDHTNDIRLAASFAGTGPAPKAGGRPGAASSKRAGAAAADPLPNTRLMDPSFQACPVFLCPSQTRPCDAVANPICRSARARRWTGRCTSPSCSRQTSLLTLPWAAARGMRGPRLQLPHRPYGRRRSATSAAGRREAGRRAPAARQTAGGSGECSSRPCTPTASPTCRSHRARCRRCWRLTAGREGARRSSSSSRAVSWEVRPARVGTGRRMGPKAARFTWRMSATSCPRPFWPTGWADSVTP